VSAANCKTLAAQQKLASLPVAVVTLLADYRATI